MNRLTTCSILVALLLLSQFSRQFAIAETPAATDNAPTVYATAGNTKFEISNLKEEEIVRVDLVLQPNVKSIAARLTDVALGDRHDQPLMALFKLEMEKPGDSQAVPAILIRVRPRSLRTGTYKLRIEIRPATPIVAENPQTVAKSKKAVAKPAAEPAPANAQFLELEIQLPAAEIKVLEKLVIHQVWNSFFRDDQPILALTEVSGKEIRLTEVKIDQTYPASAENVGTSQTVNFTTVPEIAPLSTGKSTINLSGPFPLGSTTGAALVSAPQLARPVWISFEVQSRRARWIIFAAILLGLALGFVARIWTKHRIELQEARLNALDAADTLKGELRRRPDTVFHGKIHPILVHLETVIESGNVQSLKQEITDVNTALRGALNDLDVRRARVTSELETLTRLVRMTSSLPSAIATTITIDAEQLAKARNQADLDNVAAAHQTMTPLISNLGITLGKAVEDWGASAKSLLEQVAGISPFLPAPVAEGIVAEKTAIAGQLDGLLPSTEASSLEDIASLLNSLRRAGDMMMLFVKNRARPQLENSLNSLKWLLSPVQKPEPKLVDQLFKDAEDLPKKLAGWAEKPEAGAKDLAQALAHLKLEWREALLHQITGGDNDLVSKTKTAIEDSLDLDQYVSATFTTVAFLREHPPQLDLLVRKTGAEAGVGSLVSAAGVVPLLDMLSGEKSDAGLTVFSIVREQTLPPNLEAWRTRTWQELALAKALRFVIASCIILAIGYVLFAEKFTGTFSELMAAFVWAFGLNISVDTVMDSIKPVKIG